MSAKNKSEFLSWITGVYVFIICAIFPLAVNDYYFDILNFKYHFYCVASIGMLVLFVLYGLIEGRRKWRSVKKDLIKKLSVADYGVLAFLVVSVISLFTSKYFYESFWGNEGRYSGLFLLIQYVAVYFCISRYWKFKVWYVDAFLISAMLACLFGITDYFQMDLMGFKVTMVETQRPIFTSTFGNINTYTAYVGMVMAVSSVMFTVTRTWKKTVWYFLCMVISFTAIIMGISDNAYMSIGALFGLLPIYLFQTKEGIRRYLAMTAAFLTVVEGIGWVNVVMADQVLGIDSVFVLIHNIPGLTFFIVLLWIAIGLWYVYDWKVKKESSFPWIYFRNIWLVLLGVFMIVFIAVLWDSNFGSNPQRYQSFANYLVFDDDWGSHRGYIWRNAMESFREFSPVHKLVGFGPDTFGIVLKDKTYGNIYHEIFDSAHNEYLHYLVTVGIAGLVAYVVFLAGFFVRCIRTKQLQPWVYALIFGVICYLSQAVVNINLPIVTPFMWLLISMTTAALNDK